MKKRVLFACIVIITHLEVEAQLQVNQDGSTVIGDPTYYEGFFNVVSRSDLPSYSLSYVYASSNICALEIYNSPDEEFTGYSNLYGISISCANKPNIISSGISSNATSYNSLNTGRAYGIITKAGNSTPGWNYGVCASLLGQNNGAGLYASAGNNPDGLNVNGRWAGFFDGDMKVVGNITATTITTTSDFRLKENIRQIDDGILNKVMEMNTVVYNIKNQKVDLGDTAKVIHYAFPDDSPILKSEHYGLIAQELKEIYPELVNEDEDGFLSINYIELVPILIKSIQELKTEVDNLCNIKKEAIQRNDETIGMNIGSSLATLFQNTPNPFNENTTIKCVIPSNVRNANLYIYDMNGRQIERIEIRDRGNVSLTVTGGSLEAGIYLYSLVTDGLEIGTNRMILTK